MTQLICIGRAVLLISEGSWAIIIVTRRKRRNKTKQKKEKNKVEEDTTVW